MRRVAEESSRNGSNHTYAVDKQSGNVQSIPRHGGDRLAKSDSSNDESNDEYHSTNEAHKNIQDPRAVILSATELELAFVKWAPDLSGIYRIR